MDEADVPENCLILSQEELARLGVKELLTTSAAKQSENNQGKQTAIGKKEIEGLGCLQILNKSSLAKTDVHILNNKRALNKESIQSITEESMNLLDSVPAVEAKQVINTKGEREMNEREKISPISLESVKRIEQQNPSERAADGKSPTKSLSKNIQVLCNTKVHIPTDDLKEMISRSVSQREVLHATKYQNMSVIPSAESQTEMHDFRKKLSRILATDKLFGKFATNRSSSVTRDGTTNNVPFELKNYDSSPAAENNNQRTSEGLGNEFPQSHLNQQTLSTEIGNQSCGKGLDVKKNSNSFHMTLNYKEFSFKIKEVELDNHVSENSVQVDGQQDISETIKNEKKEVLRHNLQNLLGTGDPSYNLRKIQHSVPDSDTHIEHTSTHENRPLSDVQNNLKLNLKDSLVTGDPFYTCEGKTLHQPCHVLSKKATEAKSLECGKNREILFRQGDKEIKDDICAKNLSKRLNNVYIDATEVLKNTNTNIISNLYDFSSNNKISVYTSSYNDAETDIFDEYLSEINCSSEGITGNSANLRIMENNPVESVSNFCNMGNGSSEDESNIFEECMSKNMREPCMDIGEYSELHTRKGTECYYPNELKNVADQSPENNSENVMKKSGIDAGEYFEQHTITNTEYYHPNGSEKVADQLPKNSENVTTPNSKELMSDNSSYNRAENSGFDEFSEGSEKEKGPQSACTDSIDCKDSTEAVSLVLYLNENDRPILPETPCPNLKRLRIASKREIEENNEASIKKTKRKSNRNPRKNHTADANFVIKFREDSNPPNIVVEASDSQNQDSVANPGRGGEIRVDNVVLRFHSNDAISSNNAAKIELLQQSSHASDISDLVPISESSRIKNRVRTNYRRLISQVSHQAKRHDEINALVQEESLHPDSCLSEKRGNVSKDISNQVLKNTDNRGSKKYRKAELNMPLKNPNNSNISNKKDGVDTTINIADGNQKNLGVNSRKRKPSNKSIAGEANSYNSESGNSSNTRSLRKKVKENHTTKRSNVNKLEVIPNIPNNPSNSRITVETENQKHISNGMLGLQNSLKSDKLNVVSNQDFKGQISVETNSSHKNSDTPSKVQQSQRIKKSQMHSSVNGSPTSMTGNLDSEFEDPSIHFLSRTSVKRRGEPKEIDIANHSDENYPTNQETSTKRRRRSKNESQGSKKRKIDICEEEAESVSCNISNEEDIMSKSKNPFRDSISKHNEHGSEETRHSPSVDETINYQPNMPRKRGRPKKRAVETTANDTFETKPDLPIGMSKRGRKIIPMNYSMIECGNVTDSENNTNDNKEESLILRTEDISNNLDSSNLKSKYKWTGATATAVNQLFKVLQGKDVQEVSHDAESGLKKRKRGRTKNEDHLLDISGTSVCMVCNETIANRDWIQHKREVHYNLTWRMGESPLDISDRSVILKKYKEIQSEQKYLKCNKCGKEVKRVDAFVDHLEICNGVVNGTGLVVCAVCKKQMGKSEWQYHKYREHNNLAWREGDPPLNLQDQDLVVRILTQLYKAKKPLHCETCKQQKKSVMGYLSHKSVCNLSLFEVENVKVACRICQKKVLPVSMESHMKIHNKPEPSMLMGSGYFEINLDATGPRQAAKNALKVIKSIKGELGSNSKYYVEQCDFDDDFVMTVLKKKASQCPDLSCLFSDCDFKDSSVDSMINHLKSCEKKPKQYIVCKLCLSWFTDESEIKDHLKSVHNKIVLGDTDVDLKKEIVECTSDDDIFIEEVEMEKKRLRLKGRCTLMNNASHRVKPIFLIHPMREQPTLVYGQAFPWMINFCEKHYSIPNLFDEFRNCDPWPVLDCDILDNYLPRHHESCDITVKALTYSDILGDKDLEYRKLELFEVCNFYNGEATIFCGGPVTTLAWLPTPYIHEDHNQLLAVAVVNEADKEYSVGETYNEPYIIQFWNFGKLNWRQEYDIKPSLLFGLALHSGPVWHLEWCPSGCFDSLDGNSRSRLGLLAVATSDSFVYFYTIDDIKEEDDRGLIYKGKPVAKLQLDADTNSIGQAYYPTRISWTKAKEHRYIAVGYSTGMIALFDLLSVSPLFRKADQSGTPIFFPYQTFQGHVSCITGLTLGHFSGGNRWCFSTGMDRALIFWDLSNMTKVAFHRKQGIAEGLWPTQWPVGLVAEEESTFNETLLAHSFTKPLRDVMSQECINFTYSQSGIKSISFSDWLNLILHGGNAGEVTGQFAHRMLFNVENKRFKKSYTKCIFSVAKLITRDPFSDHPRQSTTYEGACSNYGMAFVDYNSNNFNEIPNTKTNNIRGLGGDKYNIHDYPLNAITKVVTNPNPQACTFYATGYQAGFVRVRGMEFLKSYLNSRDFTGYDFSGYDFSDRL